MSPPGIGSIRTGTPTATASTAAQSVNLDDVQVHSYSPSAVEFDYAILADGVTARPDGKLDIYGAGWDTVYAVGVPAQHSRMTLAARVLLSVHEAAHSHQMDVILQESDGDELARVTGRLEAVPEEQRSAIPAGRKIGLGLVLNFDNVVFPHFGSYQLVILWDGNEPREPLRLFVEEPPTPAE